MTAMDWRSSDLSRIPTPCSGTCQKSQSYRRRRWWSDWSTTSVYDRWLQMTTDSIRAGPRPAGRRQFQSTAEVAGGN